MIGNIRGESHMQLQNFIIRPRPIFTNRKSLGLSTKIAYLE